MHRRLFERGFVCLVALGLLASTTVAGQDLTTRLSQFLVDLYAGTLGVTVPITSVTLKNGTGLSDAASGKVLVTGTTPGIIFGVADTSHSLLKSTSAALEARLGDDSGGGTFRANNVQAQGTLQFGSSNTLLLSSNTPTLTGFGTSPSVPNANGSASFTINVGTGGSATSGTITLPTAAHGWNCFATDQTSNIVTRQTATTATTAVLTAASAWGASDILSVACSAY